MLKVFTSILLLSASLSLAQHAPAKRLTSFREGLKRDGILKDIQVDGYRYCVAETGKGKALVLLHGIVGSIYDWRFVLEPLSKKYHVIAIDMLGSGESDMPKKADYSVPAQARRVKGVLDALEVKKATIVGNSYGGGIALMLAADWPEMVENLVLLDTVCYADDIPFYVWLAKIPFAPELSAYLPIDMLARYVLCACYKNPDKVSEEEIDTYVEEVSSAKRRIAIVKQVDQVLPPDASEFENRLRTIKAPALVVWGTADTNLPIKLGKRLVKEMPDARLVEIESGHLPNQECPEEVTKLITDFVK